MMRGQYNSAKGFFLSLWIVLVAVAWVLNAPFGRGWLQNLLFLAFVALWLWLDRLCFRHL